MNKIAFENGLDVWEKLGLRQARASYDPDALLYRTYSRWLAENGRFNEMIDLCKVYLERYPLHRRQVLRVYNLLQNHYGQEEIGKEIIKYFVEASNTILEIGKSIFGLPPFFEEDTVLCRLGELIEQTQYVHFMGKIDRNHEKPVMLLSNDMRICNPALIPYLADNFKIVTELSEKKHLIQFRHLAPYSTFFYKYSEKFYGHNSTFYSTVYPDLLKKNINPIAFSLKEKTIEKAIKFLKTFGLKDNDEFVVLHLREPGNIRIEHHHKFRNVNPTDYIDAIDWLLSNGLKVIRLGHPKMSKLPSRKGLIDLTPMVRPGEVDIYVCAKCKFYFGSVSGPISLSTHFGSYSLLTNVNQYNINLPRTLTQLALYTKNDGRIVSFDEIKKLRLSSVTSVNPYIKLGLKPKHLNRKDHLNAVKEMMEFIDHGNIFSTNLKKKKETNRANLLTSFTSESLTIL